MNTSLIKFSYKQIISHGTTDGFEQHVLNASYSEFLLKSQAYNPDGLLTTFTQIKARDGRANSLHYKSGFAIAGIVEALNKHIPSLRDSLGNHLKFDTYEFKLIESDINDKQVHQVAIYFYSGILSLFATIGEYLLLAWDDRLTAFQNEPIETFLLKVPPNFSITSYQQIDETRPHP